MDIMNARIVLFFSAMIALLFAGCDSPQRTVDTARKQLAAFQAAPDAAKLAAVEQSLAKLDQQIEALKAKGDSVQTDLLRRQASNLKSDLQAAKLAKTINDAKNAIQGFGEAIKEAGKSFNETLRNGSKETNQ